jgi:integrase
MKRTGARKTVLPTFSLTELCGEGEPGAFKRTIPSTKHGEGIKYWYRRLTIEVPEKNGKIPEEICSCYNLFPVVLNQDGVPWDIATIYLLSRLEGVLTPVMATYHGIADDLASYLRFLEKEGIDFTNFPKHKLHRPTYRFYGDLKIAVHAGEVSVTTAKRRMGTVIGFYRWLKDEGLVLPGKNIPWNESDKYLSITDRRGLKMSKKVITTDVSIKVPKQHDPYTNTIEDGGKLTPLLKDEQLWLAEALRKLGNTEIRLIHLMAIFTGSRIQTVLTMRVRHVRLVLPDGLSEIRFLVGPGTGVDTKGDKQMSLHIPVQLYEKLSTYSHSERARKRREKAAGGDTEDQYLFLSQQGAPFYQSKSQSMAFDASNKLRHSKAGQGVRQFITERVIPMVRTLHKPKFYYKFHDLRATFGMNLTNAQLELVQEGKIKLDQARNFVKTRMGHESSATTDIYLNYQQNLDHIRVSVSEYQSHLNHLLNVAMEGL